MPMTASAGKMARARLKNSRREMLDAVLGVCESTDDFDSLGINDFGDESLSFVCMAFSFIYKRY